MNKLYKLILLCTGVVIFYSYTNAQIVVVYSENRASISSLLEQIRKQVKNNSLLEISHTDLKNFSQNPLLFITIGKMSYTKVLEKYSDSPIFFTLIRDPFMEIPMNVTGVKMIVSPSQDFIFLKAVFPNIKKIGTFVPQNYFSSPFIQDALNSSSSIGLTLKVIEITQIEIKEIFSRLKECQIIWLFPNDYTLSPAIMKYLIIQSLSYKIPLYGFTREIVEKGALLGSDVDTGEYINLICTMLKKIDQGQDPLALPIRQPGKINFFANNTIARNFDIKLNLENFEGVKVVK